MVCPSLSTPYSWKSSRSNDAKSAGEIHFILIGVVLQMVAIVLESFRLNMTQLLLQSKGIKLNPITTLYYVAPCCFAALVPIFLYMEVREVMNTTFDICPWHLVANAAAAFGVDHSSES
jgi:hypothetical protein